MAKELSTFDAKLPAHLQGQADATDEFAGGVQSGFPVISYRGRVWRVKEGGEEHVHVDDEGDAVSSIEIVLVKSNERPAKIHYDKQYEDGDEGKPRCWSPDGIKPDSDVDNPISDSCQNCPMNVWGSRTTENGKKSRACSDVRRVAVMFEHKIGEDDAAPALLRIPPASLNPLKEYVTKVLKPKGVQPYMLVTKVGFDNDADYPKLTFKPSRFLSEDEFNEIVALRESEDVQRIVQSATEYSSEGTTAEGGDEPEASTKDETPAAPSESTKKKAGKKKAGKKKAAKKRDVTAAEAEAAAAAEAEVVDEEDEDETVPTTVEEEETETVEEDDSEEEVADGDFDAMLKSVLGED